MNVHVCCAVPLKSLLHEAALHYLHPLFSLGLRTDTLGPRTLLQKQQVGFPAEAYCYLNTFTFKIAFQITRQLKVANHCVIGRLAQAAFWKYMVLFRQKHRPP
jgi:hypothetical protein